MTPIDPQILERINAGTASKFSSLAVFNGSKISLSNPQKKALLFVAVVAVGISLLLLLSAQARPTADVLRATPQPSASESVEQSFLVIDVQGEVKEPGLYQLPLGARVGDAIKAAGGVRKGSETSSVNLARFLEDGEQIYVAGNIHNEILESAGGAGISRGAGIGGKLNLNRATVNELDGLPGVGPVLAKRIVEYRNSNGNFSSVDELQKVSGIGPAKYGELQNFVTV